MSHANTFKFSNVFVALFLINLIARLGTKHNSINDYYYYYDLRFAHAYQQYRIG